MAGPEESLSNQNLQDKTSLDDTIDKLIATFRGQCKVLENSGKFKKIIKLNPDGQNIVFNFKIPGK